MPFGIDTRSSTSFTLGRILAGLTGGIVCLATGWMGPSILLALSASLVVAALLAPPVVIRILAGLLAAFFIGTGVLFLSPVLVGLGAIVSVPCWLDVKGGRGDRHWQRRADRLKRAEAPAPPGALSMRGRPERGVLALADEADR